MVGYFHYPIAIVMVRFSFLFFSFYIFSLSVFPLYHSLSTSAGCAQSQHSLAILTDSSKRALSVRSRRSRICSFIEIAFFLNGLT